MYSIFTMFSRYLYQNIANRSKYDPDAFSTKNGTKEWLAINLGAVSHEQTEQRHLQALMDPKTFIDKRNELLKKYIDTTYDVFDEVVDDFVKHGFPVDDARQMAFDHVKGLHSFNLSIVDKLYPPGFLSTDLQKDKTTGQTGAPTGEGAPTLDIPR